ncbi:hypothetical protein K8R66_04510, partial [bacterium]|nr:hypothetical protein [bacterium]
YQILSKDLDHDNLGEEKVEMFHVCIPFSRLFISEVINQIKKNQPKFVIIESTVDVGTTKKINQKLASKIVVHSPVRGKHPNLTKSLKCFVKYIGADDQRIGQIAKNHCQSLGIKTKLFLPSQSTELNKILSTSYYGVCIAWAKEVARICDQYGVSYDTFKDFNRTYNLGYQKMKNFDVIRPTLYPPQKGIGGHCVWENAQMFNPQVKSKFLKLIIEAGKDQTAKTLKLKK